MTKILLSLLALLFAGNAWAVELSAEQVLAHIDANQVFDHAIIEASMVIHSRSGDRSIALKSWSLGEDKSFSEYLAPAREKGKKMLKVGDKLWTYTPEPHDRIIAISGHLLKQSVMGSDLSYDDMMRNDSLAEAYQAEILGYEVINGRECIVLHLQATQKDVSYDQQKLWVDAERFVTLQAHMLAKNGKLLKQFQVKDVFEMQGRWVAKHMHFQDMLASGGGTEYLLHSIDLETEVPERLFSKASLR